MRIAAAALIVALLAGAWSAGWFYAAHEAGRQVDLWLENEAALGRHWSCPKRAIGGFPTGITISCDDAAFSGRGLGQNVEGSVSRLAADISILHPTTATIRADAPLSYRTSDGDVSLTARWTSLAIDIDGPLDVRRISLRGRDVAVEGNFAGAGRQQGTAGKLAADFSPSKRASDPVIAYKIGVAAAKIPLLDAFAGGEDPVDIHVEGEVDHTSIGNVRTPEEAMEKWRRAGGSVNLAKSSVSRGETSVRAHGTLRLDDEHRMAGKLDATFVGLGPVLKRYGINGNLVAIGSLLSTMFGGKQSREPTEPGAVTLPIRFEQGHLAIGPIVTQVQLLPVY